MSNIGKQLHIATLAADLNPELIGALVYTESGGNPWASRFEPNFYRRYLRDMTASSAPGYVPPASICNWETERMLRSFSFGLFQIMGETARENGFNSPILSQLLEPSNNIALGLQLIRKYLEAHKGDLQKALLTYNGGGNEKYPDLVLGNITNGNWQLVYSPG